MVSDHRINIWNLAQIVLLVLIMPTAASLVVDYSFGTWPIFTIVVFTLCMPVAALMLNRAALREMDRVIQAVAPELPDEAEADMQLDLAAADEAGWLAAGAASDKTRSQDDGADQGNSGENAGERVSPDAGRVDELQQMSGRVS